MDWCLTRCRRRILCLNWALHCRSSRRLKNDLVLVGSDGDALLFQTLLFSAFGSHRLELALADGAVYEFLPCGVGEADFFGYPDLAVFDGSQPPGFQ